MRLSDFDYHLSPERIAQTPLEPRDSSRLLVLDKSTGHIKHCVFHDILGYLNPGDLLVMNQTRVIPARIYATKPSGGRVEILLLRRLNETRWEALVGGKRVIAGMELKIGEQDRATVVEELPEGRRIIEFNQPIEPYLRGHGEMPLPPYIHEKLANGERYQTVYSQVEGSAAAPTAGLHFTHELLEAAKSKGIGVAKVTLHVGLDTFAPVKEDDPREHHIHTEWCEVTAETSDQINNCIESGGRVIAVGTTSVRTLESAAEGTGRVQPFSGPTGLYILPGYQFKVVDAMITNFHLPKSTLLMLVSAFAGRERILATYEEAIRREYRFFSFGDAMLIY